MLDYLPIKGDASSKTSKLWVEDSIEDKAILTPSLLFFFFSIVMLFLLLNFIRIWSIWVSMTIWDIVFCQWPLIHFLSMLLTWSKRLKYFVHGSQEEKMSWTVADAVDYKGFPVDRSKTGGWIPAALILGMFVTSSTMNFF